MATLVDSLEYFVIGHRKGANKIILENHFSSSHILSLPLFIALYISLALFLSLLLSLPLSLSLFLSLSLSNIMRRYSLPKNSIEHFRETVVDRLSSTATKQLLLTIVRQSFMPNKFIGIHVLISNALLLNLYKIGFSVGRMKDYKMYPHESNEFRIESRSS